MVEDYLSDRETEEALRSWWSENWRWILSGVALGIALLGGWRYWEYHTTARGEGAAKIFHDLETAVETRDAARIEPLLKELDQKYGSTPYADQAKLLRAKTLVDSGKLDEAAALLRSVAEHSKDDNLAQVARIRLARVLSESGKHDDALKLLDANKAGAFAAEVHETRGDILLAKGDTEGARQAYAAAATTMGADRMARRELLEFKLQDLSAPTPVKANTAKP